jgi:hypothetical protein
MVWNAAGAAAFFFVLQRFVMKAEIETSLVWALAGAAGAAWLAWHQAKR